MTRQTNRAIAAFVATVGVIASCSSAPTSIDLAEHGPDELILELDMGVGNVSPEEAAQDKVDVAVYGDGRVVLLEGFETQADQAQIDRALAVLDDLLSNPEGSAELAGRMLSDDDDGGVALVTALIDGDIVRIALPGHIERDQGSSSEADRVLGFRAAFLEVADPDFWR